MSKRNWTKKDSEKIYISKEAYRDLQYAIQTFFEMKDDYYWKKNNGYDEEDIMRRWVENYIKRTSKEIEKDMDEHLLKINHSYKNLDNEVIAKIKEIIRKDCTKENGDGANPEYDDCWRHYLSDGYVGSIDHLFYGIEDITKELAEEIARDVYNDVLYDCFEDEELKEIWQNS